MVDYAIDIRKQLYPDQEIPEVCVYDFTKLNINLKSKFGIEYFC